MDEPHIRAATVAEVPAIAESVEQAYRHYVDRMGKPPGPMLDDDAARVLEGVVWVLEEGAVVTGIIVLLPMAGYLLLDNVAVSPARQGLGLGRRLLAFAEAEALRHGYHEIRLYTHQTMVENQRLYAQSVRKRRDAAPRPATTASSCASSFADNDFVCRLRQVP